jgi:hypothetical protein
MLTGFCNSNIQRKSFSARINKKDKRTMDKLIKEKFKKAEEASQA